jgi:hypothetical protein
MVRRRSSRSLREESGARIQEPGGVSRGARLAGQAEFQRAAFSKVSGAMRTTLLAPDSLENGLASSPTVSI